MAGRRGRNEKVHQVVVDDKVASHIRGWLKQEINDKTRKGRTYIRNPKGYDLAHARGFEAAKGFGYQYAAFQTRDLHRLQHKYDNYGRKNKTPAWFLQKQAIEQQGRDQFREQNNIQFPRYASVPKPGGVKLVFGQGTRSSSIGPVSRVRLNNSIIEVCLRDGTISSYASPLTSAELLALRRGLLSTRRGVSISLEMGEGKYETILDGLGSDSPLRSHLFKADMTLAGLTFGLDYFTGQKFVCSVPGARNHFDVRTEILGRAKGATELARLGYDKFSTILPHPTLEINHKLQVKLDRKGGKSGIRFEGQELVITSRGVYIDWMGEVYYDDGFSMGGELFPILQHFASNYALYKQHHPEINRIAEYARALLLLNLDPAVWSAEPTAKEALYFSETQNGGLSLTRSVHPSVLQHTVALLQAQETLLLTAATDIASNPLCRAHIAYFIAACWESTELGAHMDTAILLYIYALQNLSPDHLKVPNIVLQLSIVFKKHADHISEEVTQILLNTIHEQLRDGEFPLHEKLSGLAYDMALDACDDFVLAGFYMDAFPEEPISSDNVYSTWANAALKNQAIPVQARSSLANWQQDPTNIPKLEALLSVLRAQAQEQPTRVPVLVSLLLYMKSITVYEQRLGSVWKKPGAGQGVSVSLVEAVTWLAECVDTLKIAAATTGSSEFIPLVCQTLGFVHIVLGLDKQLLLAECALTEAKKALSRHQFQVALQQAHLAKSHGEALLQAGLLLADGRMTCRKAAVAISRIYEDIGNKTYAVEWGRVADKERMAMERLKPAPVPDRGPRERRRQDVVSRPTALAGGRRTRRAQNHASLKCCIIQ